MTTATVLQPIPFNTDRPIIFDVDLNEIELDPSFPYTGFLCVTQHWRHPLEVELWPLPEGMSEPELLSQGFYQTSIILSGARLYVHHTQVAEFVEAQDLFDHSNPNPEAKTVHYTAPFEMRALTLEIFSSFFGKEKPKQSSSKAIHPLLVEPSKQILERVERLDHLRESGFLTEVFRPHEVLRVSLSHLDHTQLPCCLEVEAKSPSRILIFGGEPFFQLNGIETTMDIPHLWNVVKGLQMCFWDYEYFESFSSLDIIYLLCRYFNCIPLSGLASGFDAQLDLMDNWEWSCLPGADWDVCASLVSGEVRSEAERISQGWKIREKGIEQEVSLEVAPVNESGEVQRYLYLSAEGWEELHSQQPLDLEDFQLLVGVRGHKTTIEYLTDRISMSGLEVEILMDAEARTRGLEPYCLDPKTFEALPGNILIVTREERRITGFPEERIEWCLSLMCTRGDLPYHGTRKTTNYCREEVLAAFQGRPQSRLSLSSVQIDHDQVSVDEYFDDSPDIDELEFRDRLIESNNRQDEDQKKELLDFVGVMEQHINKLPANERNDYADQLEQVKATDSIPELKDRVNQLSRDLYAKSYDNIQHDIAMMTAISGGVLSEQPENITERLQELDDTQGTATPSVPISQTTQNTFWITHEASYLKSEMTCVKTTRTLAQARLDAYYILSEGYEAFDENQNLSDIEPSQESVCHLLVKFFGYEICEYNPSAIEIDLYDLWNWTQDDIHPTNKSWDLWLNVSRFRWGFYPELMAIMDGSLNVDRLPQYLWNSQHESVTGWDCGEYIIEVPFNLFNSQSEAEEFGRSCFALQTNEKYPSLFRLFYGDGGQACLRKDAVIVYRKPSMSYEVNPDDRASWELTDLSAEDIPDLEISGPLYCQGQDAKEGVSHAN
ncbi:hypothetical protein [Acaryochloris marina]|uniref:hypothetical protein n=1 Tax=Acaryochloris marina TaxID=155978 RepID=UPI001BAEFB32|nr:hypothetical protein [Acaryochloris marina]QUY45568.1 hypothetical protein I1H34_27860 [Acaryochloris marina S15]